MSLKVANVLMRSRKNLTRSCSSLSKRQSSKDSASKISNAEENAGQDFLSSVSIGEKYKIFRDQDAPIIFDVSEEMNKMNLEALNEEVEYRDPYEGINMERGVNGVYEIEDLVALLKKDNAKNIFVASVPKKFSYIDYIVVVSARSGRHMTALSESVRKGFKIKRHSTDMIPKIEGKDSHEWQALDLGNIALHVLSDQTREIYDLETLWSVGSQYDDLTHKKSEQLNVIEQYNDMLKDFEPADS